MSPTGSEKRTMASVQSKKKRRDNSKESEIDSPSSVTIVARVSPAIILVISTTSECRRSKIAH